MQVHDTARYCFVIMYTRERHTGLTHQRSCTASGSHSEFIVRIQQLLSEANDVGRLLQPGDIARLHVWMHVREAWSLPFAASQSAY